MTAANPKLPTATISRRCRPRRFDGFGFPAQTARRTCVADEVSSVEGESESLSSPATARAAGVDGSRRGRGNSAIASF